MFAINRYIFFLAAESKHQKAYIKYVHMFIYLFNKVNVNMLILEVSTLWAYFTKPSPKLAFASPEQSLLPAGNLHYFLHVIS